MALTTGAFPYDIDSLLGGAVRVLYAKADGTAADPGVPGSIADVIAMKAPYAALPNWKDVGATKESFTYTRGFASEGYEIQQVAGNVLEEITSSTRTIEVSFAEFRPEILQLIEGAPSVADVAAIAGASAQKKVSFGAIRSLDRYRFAFISRRSKQSGVVHEVAADPGRGRFFMGTVYSAQLAADDVSMEQAKGSLTASGVSWTCFPEEGEPEGEEYGAWFDELAGTIGA